MINEAESSGLIGFEWGIMILVEGVINIGIEILLVNIEIVKTNYVKFMMEEFLRKVIKNMIIY